MKEIPKDMLRAAIQQADERAAREGRDMAVYHAARDQWGRDAVFYVRPADGSEGGVPFDQTTNTMAETVYRTKIEEGEVEP